MNKNLYKDKNKSYFLWLIMSVAIILLIVFMFSYKKKFENSIQKQYNQAFYELNDYVQNVEIYLAKAMVSKSAKGSSENLTYIWREANLAQTYLSMIPLENDELKSTSKFLNQVSDYSYSLSRKTFANETLNEEDYNKLNELYENVKLIEQGLCEVSNDYFSGNFKWNDNSFEPYISNAYEKENSNFNVIEDNFHEYEGLIYDGAFSEHMINPERLGLIGDEISVDSAKEKIYEIINKENIKDLNNIEVSDEASIPSFDFQIRTKDNREIWFSISKKGGHIISFNCNRNVTQENLTQDEIEKSAEDFLEKLKIGNMRKTYYSKNCGVETINFAYVQDDVLIYSDLIKVKVAMDNGEILGIETTGYLNCHTVRTIKTPIVSESDAKKMVNNKVEIEYQRLVIIPTEFHTEKFCWEFKGILNNNDFLIYINAETGDEEDILIILNSENGVFTI